jgi:hypothetical protein
MKRWAVFAVPFVLSLCLSAATVGRHAYWQDSGLYLTAVKELGVLYPPGFVLYEVLCRLWTLVFAFLDFTLAVHLFSSACAALAAGTTAVAARDLLLGRGPLLRVTEEEDPGGLADGCGMLAGVILACGFTFWSAAIYAKGYSFYYLILSLLLWRMIRADASGRRRDFIVVAALAGLAWQAHPSALLLGGALVLFVAGHRRTLGPAGILQGSAAAAACALGPSLVLLPWLASRDPWLLMGNPADPLRALTYVTGRRFVAIPGVFGPDSVRVASFGRFLGEEFLIVGTVLMAWGLVEVARKRTRLAWGVAAWTVPYATVTILFKIEGQHDCWFVAAWFPLVLLIAVGAWRLARASGAKARVVLAAAGMVAVASSGFLNGAEISQRDYGLAEALGRTLLDAVDRDAVLLLSGDDCNALVSYLQRVRGDRTDVLLVTSNFLDSPGGARWYEESLTRRTPALHVPDYESVRGRFPGADRKDVAVAAFLGANLGLGRPLFCERLIPLEMMPRGFTLIPTGVIWKVVPLDATTLDPRYWRFPVEPENIPVGSRRARGQKVTTTGGSVEVEPQRYEERLRGLLVMARFHLAMAQVERGQFRKAAALCESIIALDPVYWDNAEIVHLLGISLHAAGEREKAERALRRSSEISPSARNRATARFYLGQIAKARGDAAEAARWFEAALSVPGLDAATRREIESRMKTP